MVQFLLVTAQRRDEAASLRHGDILDGTWKQADNKAGRPHSLKLPRLALDLVGKGQAQELVFGGAGGGKLAGFSKFKRALDREAKVSGWTLHDLRRTAATRMQGLGVRNEVVQASAQPRAGRSRRRLSARRARGAEGRGAQDLVGRARPHRQAARQAASQSRHSPLRLVAS